MLRLFQATLSKLFAMNVLVMGKIRAVRKTTEDHIQTETTPERKPEQTASYLVTTTQRPERALDATYLRANHRPHRNPRARRLYARQRSTGGTGPAYGCPGARDYHIRCDAC